MSGTDAWGFATHDADDNTRHRPSSSENEGATRRTARTLRPAHHTPRSRPDTTPTRRSAPPARRSPASSNQATKPQAAGCAKWARWPSGRRCPPTPTRPKAPAGKARGLRLRGDAHRPRRGPRRRHRTRRPVRLPGDEEWPGQLDDLGDSRPIGLWVRGTANLRLWALRSVAVVGARACTEYGAHLATTLGAALAERGWTVASGAAYGVDGAAHRGALAADGPTLAVLASGVDHAYPRGHTELLARIAEQGLLVAELPPGAHPTRSRFIQRNRVIAALTRGTVVVEAELRSGSLVTARRALALGRYTMGVPGPVTSGLSAGVHQLLRSEGVLVTDADESSNSWAASVNSPPSDAGRPSPAISWRPSRPAFWNRCPLGAVRMRTTWRGNRGSLAMSCRASYRAAVARFRSAARWPMGVGAVRRAVRAFPARRCLTWGERVKG